MWRLNLIPLILPAVLLAGHVYCQSAIQPDAEFGSNGLATLDLQIEDPYPIEIKTAPDSKIWVIAYADTGITQVDYLLSRYHTDGSIDNSFGENGKLLISIFDTENYPRCALIQPDGKLIVAGYVYPTDAYNYMDDDFALVRFNTDGSLDPTFGENGIVVTKVSQLADYIVSIALQQDGKIIAVGLSNSDFGGSQTKATIVRYNENGTLDSGFGNNGIVADQINGNEISYAGHVAVQNNGTIIISGFYYNIPLEFPIINNLFIKAYEPDGNPKTTFGINSLSIPEIGNGYKGVSDMVILPTNEIIISGETGNINDEVYILKLNENGTVDNNFGINGTLKISDDNGVFGVRKINLLPDNRFIISGAYSRAGYHLSSFMMVLTKPATI